MDKRIGIPATLDEAVTALNGVGRLLTAKQWERAAIVYAFTRDGVRGEGGPGRNQNGEITTLLPSEFAGLGIIGLKSDQTVRTYRKAWQDAIADGQAEDISPGQEAVLPTREWPPTGHSRGFIDKARATASVTDRVEVVRTHLADPDVAAAAAADREVRTSFANATEHVEDDLHDQRCATPSTDRKPTPTDLVADLRTMHRIVDRVAHAVANGEAVVNEDMAGAIVEEVHWLRNALDLIESGVNAGSLDEALARLAEDMR